MRDYELEQVVSQIVDCLKEERKRQGLSYEKLAEKAGVSKSIIGLYENKERKPTIHAALKISKALNIKLSDILVKLEQ